MSYLSEYGEVLAEILQMTVSVEKGGGQAFFHAPSYEISKRSGLTVLEDFLDVPSHATQCFCHVDFQHANICGKITISVVFWVLIGRLRKPRF